MKFAVIVLCLTLSGIKAQYRTETRILSAENSEVISASVESEPESTVARWTRRGVPPDNGKGNYGDLIHKCREPKDGLVLREVLVDLDLASVVQDIVWSVNIPRVRVTSVRFLNFGRQRAYCLRIDVAGGNVQIIARLPPLIEPRIMIEVYGIYY